jgi:hypothetical protein
MEKKQIRLEVTNLLNDVGYLMSDFTEEQLKPIKDEIKKIKDSNFIGAIPNNKNLAGNLKYEFNLIDCFEYVSDLMEPMIKAHQHYFNSFSADLLLNSKECPVVLDKLWVNFMRKNEFNPLHDHSGVFSFVIWIDIPYDIEDEMNNESSVDSNNNRAAHFSFFYINALGKIVDIGLPVDKKFNNKACLFPARLNHAVYPFKTSEDFRISVSGNFKFYIP